MKQNYIFKGILLFIFLFLSICLFAQKNSGNPLDKTTGGFGNKNVIKLAPSFSPDKIKGGIFSYETGIGRMPLTINYALKYFAGRDSITPNHREIIEHIRLELQLKYYLLTFMNGPYLGGTFMAYTPLAVSGSIISGFQVPMGKFFMVDGFAGIQINNSVDNFPTPFFFRIGLSLGYTWSKRN